MRTVLILFITLVIVGAGFLAYEWMQPARSMNSQSAKFPTGPANAPAGAPANSSIPISGGTGVYIEKYDTKKGYLSQKFRSANYDPQPDGTVRVSKVEAEFYSETGQMMRVKGETGEVVVPATGGGTSAMARPPMPTRGKLNNVTLMLFPPGARWPTITCTVPNVSFDNDTFIIQTDAFKDAKGNEIAADQVPVAMRGDDYDFDGRGLTIHWDERNRRLARLEIAHGHSLILKHPKGLGIATSQPSQPHAENPAPRSTSSSNGRRATSKPAVAAANEPMSTTQPSTQSSGQEAREGDPYRAEFRENVRIVQGPEELANCELMNVDFLMGSHEPATQPAAQPATEPSRPTSPRGAAQRSNRAAAAKSAPSKAAPAPATQPDEQPIVILWTGKLVVSPSPDDVAHPHGKDAIIEMVGSAHPVIARRQGSEVQCSSLRLHTDDDSLFLRNSPQFPQIIIRDANGTSIISRSFEYDGQSRTAMVRGSSHAEFPVSDKSSPTTKPATFARVDWTQSCTLKMAPSNQRDQMTIQEAQLRGEVKIDHPQMQMTAGALDLSFDPDAPRSTKPADANDATQNAAIKHMTARENVRGKFVDPDAAQNSQQNPPQTIDCQTLNVDFDRAADGHSFPTLAVADGDVISGDGKSELRAGHLEATLAPTTAPTTGPSQARVAVQTVFAQQNVRATSSDGKDIRCDQLHMTQGKDGPLYTLQGTESAPARAGDAQSTLIGRIITFSPNLGRASVQGAGSMHAVQQSKSTTKPSTQPIDLTWDQGLEADGRANRIDITGNITATTKLDDGSVNVVQGSRMRIDLTDAPTTQPTTPGATKKSPTKSTTRPARSDMLGDSGAFKDKIVKAATVESAPAQSEVRSTLLAADGTLLRRLHLFATTIIYEAQAKRMVVPVPGKMLYEDRRNAPATQASTQQPMQISMRGATAFQWQKDFIFDDAAHTATMTGNVDVVHRGAPTESFRLNAQRVIAELEPSESKNLGDGGKLKRVIAEGDVLFNASRLQFTAQRIEYDPNTQELVAIGTDSQPVTMLDANGLSQGTFKELRYNAKTDSLKTTGINATIRRTGS